MEASQVKGLGSMIIRMKMNDPSISKILEVDPDVIVQFLIKLCCIHWERSGFGALILSKSHFFICTYRGTEKLINVVGYNVVEYLNKFSVLENLDDIVAWKSFCEGHPSKELRGRGKNILLAASTLVY